MSEKVSYENLDALCGRLREINESYSHFLDQWNAFWGVVQGDVKFIAEHSTDEEASSTAENILIAYKSLMLTPSKYDLKGSEE